MLTEEELREVQDETAVVVRGLMARQPGDVALCLVEVLGYVYMAHNAGNIPDSVMGAINRCVQKLPRLGDHIDVLAQEAVERAEKRR